MEFLRCHEDWCWHRRYQILGFLIIIHFTREVHYSLLICVCEQRRSYNIWNQGASRDLGGACVVKKTFCKEIYFYLVPCNPLASFRSAAVCEVWRIIHMLVCCFFIVFFLYSFSLYIHRGEQSRKRKMLQQFSRHCSMRSSIFGMIEFELMCMIQATNCFLLLNCCRWIFILGKPSGRSFLRGGTFWWKLTWTSLLLPLCRFDFLVNMYRYIISFL
jgi:hypothetical protein